MNTDEHKLKLVLDLIEDNRKIIAAGKSQRWDVLKWGVAINLAIPAAIIATKPQQPCLFFGVSAMVAFLGIILIFHYTRRMTGARNNAACAYRFLRDGGLDLKGASKDALTDDVTIWYDLDELAWFSAIFIVSCLPTLFVAAS